MTMQAKKTKKNIKFTTIAWIMAIMLLVIIIPVNIFATVFDAEFDLTSSNMYSLTDTTKNYLNSIDEKIDFYLLMEMDDLRETEEAVRGTVDDITAFVSMLDAYAEFDCINFIDIDPDKNPDIAQELNPDGFVNLSHGDMVLKCGDNVKRIQANSMYSDKVDAEGNILAEYFHGENLITGAIKSVVEGIMPSVYFLTGHGEKTLEKDYTQFRKNLKNYNYDAKELNLTTADAVPDDAAIIIVAAPQSDITDDERSKLEEYLDKGGNLSLLMSPNNEDFNYVNIDEIMLQYGLAMDYNIVSETSSDYHVSGDENTILVNLVDASAHESEDAVDLTSALIDAESIYPYMPASRSLYNVQTENASDLVVCPLIETYDTALGKPYGGTEVDPDEISGKLYLAAYSMDRTRNNSKIVFMGNAEFIDDTHVSEDYTIVPVLLYLSSISWMYGSDVDMGVADKTLTSDQMVLATKEDTKMMLGILYSAPVVVGAIGLITWLRRRNA